MRKHDIENWVLRIVDQVKASQPNEDSRVELKTEWLEPDKAAWQIAGHANAARGELILWLIGIDEKGQRIVGANNTELSIWYSQVKAKFDEGIAPILITDLNVPVEDKTVVALLLETDRAPFIIKNSEGGRSTHAVPLRKSKGTWCAGRSDLIRLLSPIQKLPEVEVLECELNIEPSSIPISSGVAKYSSPWKLNLSLNLYIVPNSRDRVVFPFHRCKCWIELPGIVPITELKLSRFETEASPSNDLGLAYLSPDAEYSSIKVTRSEVIVNAPGRLMLFANEIASEKYLSSTENIEINVSLGMTGADSPVFIKTSTFYPGFSEKEYKYSTLPFRMRLKDCSNQRVDWDEQHEKRI